ncbi:Uncharacterised protein [uncultured archaeon]|nr:Uncharacterised protein [uncultured archaeon]
MVDLTSIVGNLQRLGFYDFVLPWLLFFAVIFGLLNQAKIFGGNAKQVNAIIAAVLAFFIVNFTPVGGISAYYSTLFGSAGTIIAILLVLVIFAGSLGTNIKSLTGDEKSKWGSLIFVVLVIFAFLVFTQAGGAIASIGSDTMTTIFVALFVLGVMWYAMKE